jgi:hypothetical protein
MNNVGLAGVLVANGGVTLSNEGQFGGQKFVYRSGTGTGLPRKEKRVKRTRRERNENV